MKKNETSGRLLIYEDKELAKGNTKKLCQIFEKIEEMHNRFDKIEIKFDQKSFIKTLSEGFNWLTETLYERLIKNYKGLSAKVIESSA
jgi:hypothetical protein